MPGKEARSAEKLQKEAVEPSIHDNETVQAARAVGPSLLTRRTWRSGKQKTLPCEPIKVEQSRSEPRHRQEGNKATAAISRVVEQSKCPISHQLLVDPVMAEDGVIYERKCIQRWLGERRTSPATNAPMGCALVPALAARQTVGNLVEDGLVDPEAALGFFLDRARMRSARRDSSGPDLPGALKDFQQALTLATTPSQRRAIESQIKLVTWMQEGPRLIAEARSLQAEASNAEPDIQAQASALGDAQALNEWMIELGGSVRDLLVTSLAEGRRMKDWAKLPRGTRVKVVDSIDDLRRLCERAAPGAREAVEWSPDMSSWAGAVCTVKRTGRRCMKDYILKREASPIQQTFQFPFDALFLLSEAPGIGDAPGESGTESEDGGDTEEDSDSSFQ